jgi:hypothetical protein
MELEDTRRQSGVMMWIHKSISNKMEYYTFWNNRIIETRLKIQTGHLTILAVHVSTEGREGLSEEFDETLQKILDTVNKNDYIMLIGDISSRVQNNAVTNRVGSNGEAALNNSSKKMTDF